MKRRRIARTRVLDCLRHGSITEGPALDVRGNWTCRVERLVAGEEIGAALAIERTADVVVIAVFDMG